MTDASPLLAQWLLGLARVREPRTPASALRSEVRQGILSIIRSEPGITLSRLRRRAGLGWGSLYHQLEWLESSGLVRLVQVGRRRIVVPAEETADVALLAARSRLHAPSARRIAELILAGEGRNVDTLAAATGLSPRSVRYQLRGLIQLGLVEAPYPGRLSALRPTPLLRAALAPTAVES